jgi:hypothetical protein
MIPKSLLGPDLWVDGCPSHLAPLMRLINATDGPIVEFGAGFVSTPLFVGAASYKRSAVSVEADEGFRAFFHSIYFNFAGGWSCLPPKLVPRGDALGGPVMATHPRDYGVGASKWAVAFVDSRPSTARKHLIHRLRTQAKYIVVHDTEPEREPIYQYQGVLDTFEYRWDFKGYSPYTTVVSIFQDPGVLLSDTASGEVSDLDSSWIERNHKV